MTQTTGRRKGKGDGYETQILKGKLNFHMRSAKGKNACGRGTGPHTGSEVGFYFIFVFIFIFIFVEHSTL